MKIRFNSCAASWLGTAAVSLAMLISSSAYAVDVVVDGTFSSGLTSWNYGPSTTDSAAGTCGYNGVTSPGVETLTATAGFPALGATTNLTALGSVSQTAIGLRSCVLYQDVAIPTSATTAIVIV